jgi:hypothetical protein
MNWRVAGVVAAVVIAVGAAWIGLKGGGANSGSGLFGSGDTAWEVATDTDKLTGAKSPKATLRHATDDGGTINVTATCDSSTIAFDFEYHAKTDDDAHSAFEMQGEGQYIHIPYRIDSGEVQEVVSKAQYANLAEAVFAYDLPNASGPAQSGDPLMNGIAAMATAFAPGLGPQDLRKFLHANEVRFELPLAGGKSEVVGVRPQDAAFQEFVAACRIDLAAFDADAGKKDADARAAADQKAADQAKANLEAKQHDDAIVAAAQARVVAMKNACTTGGVTLRVLGGTTLSAPDNEAENIGRVDYGQIIETIADPAAVARGFCLIHFARDGQDVKGMILVGDLEPASTSP